MLRPSVLRALVLGLVLAAPAAALAAPHVQAMVFDHYTSPFAGRAGETNIGVNPYTNNAFFQRLGRVDRIHWDDTTSPPTATWNDVTPGINAQTADPILWTDRVTGRTFAVNLLIQYTKITFTDHIVGGDGATWVLTEPASTYPFFDHETVGGGPHAIPVAGLAAPADDALPAISPATPTVVPGAAHAMYYCAQLGYLVCMRSDDDGLTWGPYVPINLQDTCGGLSGHVQVDSIGTVYVPNKYCDDDGNGETSQGVHISRDNGVTWRTHYIPGSSGTAMDPAVGIDAADKLYLGMRSSGRPMISLSTDHGQTWSNAVNVDATGTIVNTVFPFVVGGDAGRAAFSFYGSKDAGDYQSDQYTGVWHLYVAMTLDGGATWDVVDTTPSDPVQRGCVWLGGGNNPCRNLLDFQVTTVDAEGRVVVGYADGCVTALCLSPTGAPGNSHDSVGKIARLTSGPRLYAAFDS